ncbi:MAG: hypothetical protein J2P46_17770, partial [Zavarzinella sp.]|nr:hypothetical protein [Zavarzinella sp.]
VSGPGGAQEKALSALRRPAWPLTPLRSVRGSDRARLGQPVRGSDGPDRPQENFMLTHVRVYSDFV